MNKILWLAPAFNHYKARFLNHLAKEPEIDLTIVSGSGRTGQGDSEIVGEWQFRLQTLEVSKSKFGKSKKVRNELKAMFNQHNWVLIPAEKKNLLLLLYASLLRIKHPKTKLFSYNHPVFKSGNGRITRIDRLLTWLFYLLYNRVIFYTEQSCQQAIQQKLIEPSKAFWANNTLDETEIQKYYQFTSPPKDEIRILFIGRLIPTKKVGLLIKYFEALEKKFAKRSESLKLDIIGDGPEATIVEDAVRKNNNINWYGKLVDEEEIAPHMKKASVVFIPGHSGLSVNHAFMYGRPYITIKGVDHAPEIGYLDDEKNGLILKGTFTENTNQIIELLSDYNKLTVYCRSAFEKGKALSVGNWVNQMKIALFHE